jgi:hypothetical protein
MLCCIQDCVYIDSQCTLSRVHLSKWFERLRSMIIESSLMILIADASIAVVSLSNNEFI